MRVITLLLLPMLVFAADLKRLIENAQQSELAQGYDLDVQAKAAGKSAAGRAYLPRITAGYTMQQVDEKGAFDPGRTQVAQLKASVVLFDGFRRENLLDEQAMNLRAAEKKRDFFKKSTALDVANLYYALLNAEEEIKAARQKGRQLEAEVSRLQKFFEAGSVSQDSVEKIKASKAMNDYSLHMLDMTREQLRFNLENLTGTSIESLTSTKIIEPALGDFENRDDLEAMNYEMKALEYKAKQSRSDYMPTIFVEESYSSYEYDDFEPAFPIEMVEKQNKITVGVSMTLFDFFSKSKEKEAMELNARRLQHSHTFAKRKAEYDLKLAKLALQTASKKIEAAKARLLAADRTYELIGKKFQANVVDNVTYLDALSEKYEAQAMYHQSLNNYEYEKAAYYFYASKDIKEYIQ